MQLRAVLAGTFLLVLFVASTLWTIHQFSREGHLEVLFSGVIWGEAIENWDEPPVDVSSKACPLVTQSMRDEILAEDPDEGARLVWSSGFGGRCLSQERVLIIQINQVDRSCSAKVDVPPPRCAF